jgi:hypothetical protein
LIKIESGISLAGVLGNVLEYKIMKFAISLFHYQIKEEKPSEISLKTFS